MVWIRIDNNKNGTITEISGADFLDLQAHESSEEVSFDFPTSQPSIFYRWDGANIVINDEDMIKSFNPEALGGLDMQPHITSILNGDIEPNSSKIITVEGMNFSPFTTATISGVGNFVNTVYFDKPTQIRLDVTAGGTDGTYDIVAYNKDLQSQDSGFSGVTVKSTTL